MSTSINYEVSFNVCGFDMRLDNKFLRIDVKCNSLKIIYHGFSKCGLILLLFFHRVRLSAIDLK